MSTILFDRRIVVVVRSSAAAAAVAVIAALALPPPAERRTLRATERHSSPASPQLRAGSRVRHFAAFKAHFSFSAAMGRSALLSEWRTPGDSSNLAVRLCPGNVFQFQFQLDWPDDDKRRWQLVSLGKHKLSTSQAVPCQLLHPSPTRTGLTLPLSKSPSRRRKHPNK